jgi:hypothetical protein
MSREFLSLSPNNKIPAEAVDQVDIRIFQTSRECWRHFWRARRWCGGLGYRSGLDCSPFIYSLFDSF